MARLMADLLGVRAGQIYPEVIPSGSECPTELLDAARELGILESQAAPERQAFESVPETKVKRRRGRPRRVEK